MTPRKEKALQALLVSRTRAEAAKAAGIGESTLRVYLQDPEFMERYRAAFTGLLEDATREAQRAISPALSTLQEIIENDGEQASARIQASRTVLEYAVKLTEQLDVIGRMTELEKTVAELEDRR